MGNSNSAHVCHSPQRASSPVKVSNSRASSTGDTSSVTRLASEVDEHVSPAQQSHSETTDHPGGRSDNIAPLEAVTTMVSTSTTSVCGPPSHHSLPLGPTVRTGVCLGWKVIPSARMKALICSTTKQQVFQKRSLGSQLLLENPLQTECMTTGGFALPTGPQGKAWISAWSHCCANSRFSVLYL